VEQNIAPAPEPVIQMVDVSGGYPRAPLEKDTVNLSIVQTAVTPMTGPETAKAELKANLEHVSGWITKACEAENKPDVILLHEFPLTGYLPGTRTDKLQMTIAIPGPETDALGQLAKDCDSYLVFGAYAHDEEWPGHVLSVNTIIGRDGNIVKAVWKPRNIKRFYSTFEITTSTVEGLNERFIEKYGIDEVFPVVQTEFGNIAVSTVQLDPFVFAAFAMKGTEIMLRTSTLFFESDVVSTAMMHNVYSAMSNMPHPSKYGGRSMVVDPNGEILGQLDGQTEGILNVQIPIAEFRSDRRLPQYSLELTEHVFNQYEEEIPMNHMDLPEAELPEDGKAMKVLLDEKSRWH
jgi:predicted amidohydrolase